MLSCREAIAGLADLDCGGLPEAERVELRRHLGRCAACRRDRREYRTVVALAREAFRGGAADIEVPEELVESILAASVRRRLTPALRLVHLLSGIAAAPLLAFYLR